MDWTPHVTVAAVIESEQRFLLIEERSDGLIVLNQPAGHWDPGETL
ncbi:MAG: NUDIX hydrolase, partial [Pseudomonadota bacterium]|nr:NUDIX hydrolase [Pseudomonadota bacterium]